MAPRTVFLIAAMAAGASASVADNDPAATEMFGSGCASAFAGNSDTCSIAMGYACPVTCDAQLAGLGLGNLTAAMYLDDQSSLYFSPAFLNHYLARL